MGNGPNLDTGEIMGVCYWFMKNMRVFRLGVAVPSNVPIFLGLFAPLIRGDMT